MSSYVSDTDSNAGSSACPFRRQRTDCVRSEWGDAKRTWNRKRRRRRHGPPGTPDVPTEEVEGDEEKVRKGTAEEALTREHQMTHLPKIPSAMSAPRQKYKANRRGNVAKLVPDEAAKKAPVKFGEQVTGDHFIETLAKATMRKAHIFPSIP